MSEPYRLAHFTDAHLPLHGRLAPGEHIGKRAFSALNWTLKRRGLHRMEIADALRADILSHAPDHVAMTGDAVNFGLPREFGAAAEWLGGFGGAEALSFVPGNHEAMQPGAERERLAAYAPFSTGEADGWPWLRRRGPLALIGVSTAVPTAPGLAQGLVGPAQIARLRERLEEARDAIRVILIHHPPTPMTRPRKALRDREAVAAVIAEAGAELALHGHDHRNELSWIDGRHGWRIPVLGAPSASTPHGGAHEPAEWRLLSFSETSGGYRIEILRRAIGANGAFTDRGRFTIDAPRAAPAAARSPSFA